MKKVIGLLIIVAAIFVLGSCVSSGGGGAASGPRHGELITCIMGRTPKMDDSWNGKFDDPAWEGAVWDNQSNVQGKPLKDENDANVSFAVVCDDTNLYVGFDITDDKLVSGVAKWPDYYLEDSVEFFIDPNESKGMSYDKDDAQVTVAAGNIGRGIRQQQRDADGNLDFTNGLLVSGKGIYADIPLKAIAVKTDKGWACMEAIPLKTTKYDIVPKDGLKIGWSVQYNDDDSGSRDRTLVWSDKDIANKSWMQSFYFGDLMFVTK
jgi:hypothetical protein